MGILRTAWQRAQHHALRAVTPHGREGVAPVFIVGCGRSGTTALGRVLGRHPEIAYLNEPRYIWRHEPKADIWSKNASGHLVLSRQDVDEATIRRLRHAFYVEKRRLGKPCLVEKLPINAFRIDYLATAFPDARFVNLVRHGVEVARSIERKAKQVPWFGTTGRKWDVLRQEALAQGLEREVAACTDDFRRGLLEWRLAVTATAASLGQLDDTRHMTIRYEELVDDGSSTLSSVLDFIGVSKAPDLVREAVSGFRRRSSPGTAHGLDEQARLIAGPALAQLGYD